MEYRFIVNGFEVDARYSEASVREIWLPLLETLTARQRALGRRLIAFLAAPPAAGKSTLAAFLQRLSRAEPGLTPLQALGMDGFHHRQDYILRHTVRHDGVEIPMARVKGAPESFDLPRLAEALDLARRGGALRWPVYDRRIHDVVEDAIPVEGDILLVEGNWLLLDEPGWRDLACDYGVFIRAEAAMLRDRLIARKLRGGLSQAEAEAFYDGCDGPNVLRCLARRRPAELALQLGADGEYRREAAL